MAVGYLAHRDHRATVLNAGPLTPITLGLMPRAARTAPDGTSGSPVLSGDGRYVFFVSDARNLVTNAVENWGLNLYLEPGIQRHGTDQRRNGNLVLGSIGDYSVSENGERVVFSGVADPTGLQTRGTFSPGHPDGNHHVDFQTAMGVGPHPRQRTVVGSFTFVRWSMGSVQFHGVRSRYHLRQTEQPALIVHEVASGESRRIVSGEFVTEHEISRDGDLVVYQNPERQFFSRGRRWTSLILGIGREHLHPGGTSPPSDIMGAPADSAGVCPQSRREAPRLPPPDSGLGPTIGDLDL